MKEYKCDTEEVSKDYEGLGMYDKELEDEILMEARMEDKLEEGIVKGKKEGKEEGLVEGIVKGKKEGVLLVALNMLKKKVPINEISSYTGLSKEKIKKISTEL